MLLSCCYLVLAQFLPSLGSNNFSSSDFNPNQTILSESPTKSLKSTHFVMINCRDSVPKHQRRSLDELSSITVSYDWKDVSQLTATHELENTVIEVPPTVLALTNMELKDRLVSLGERPGPISDTTRRVYQKHLVRTMAGSSTSDQKLKVCKMSFSIFTYEWHMTFKILPFIGSAISFL